MYTVNVNGREFKVEAERSLQKIDGKNFEADIIGIRNGQFHILKDGNSYNAEILSVNHDEKTVAVKVNNNVYVVSIRDRYDLLLKQLGIDNASGKKVNDIKAPMPGMVLNVMVENGQTIKKGDAIVVLEAMKMENILKAPADGVIRKIHVSKGDKVEKNQVMVNLE